MPTDDDDEERRRRGIEALRVAAQAPTLTSEERTFLLSAANTLEARMQLDFFDRLLVRRLLGRVVFG